MRLFQRKYIVWAIIGLVVLAGIVVGLRGQPIAVQFGTPSIQTVRQFIAEDGRTRLGQRYTVDMPVNGTVERIALEVGDVVEAGSLIAHIDPFPIEQQIREVKAMIDQAKARVTGVDVAKPKDEDFRSAEIHINEMKDALEIARKQKSVLEYDLQQATRDFERAKKLVEDGAVSQSFYDGAEVRYKSLIEQERRATLEIDAAEKGLRMAELARDRLVGSIDDNEYQREEHQAHIESLEAQLALLQHDLAKTEIRAPVTGPILEKHVENRRVMTAGSPLLEIGDLHSIEIECDVLSEEISLVKAGQPVEITGKALQGRIILGEVTRIHPAGFMKVSALGVEQQRVRTLIGFDNDTANLRPGTSVDVRIITAEAPDALAVPDRAVFREKGQWSIFVIKGNKAELRNVEIGLRNNEWAQILSGLNPNEEIVTEPKNELTPGARISRL